MNTILENTCSRKSNTILDTCGTEKRSQKMHMKIFPAVISHKQTQRQFLAPVYSKCYTKTRYWGWGWSMVLLLESLSSTTGSEFHTQQHIQLGMVVNTSNPSTWNVELENSKFKVSLRYKVSSRPTCAIRYKRSWKAGEPCVIVSRVTTDVCSCSQKTQTRG